MIEFLIATALTTLPIPTNISDGRGSGRIAPLRQG